MLKIVSRTWRCTECDEELHEYTDPVTGKEGLSCDSCGWSWDNEPEPEPAKRKRIPRSTIVQRAGAKMFLAATDIAKQETLTDAEVLTIMSAWVAELASTMGARKK